MRILVAARRRAGLDHATCDAACLPDPAAGGRDGAGAVPAQGGHASVESTRTYLHRADDWLAAQYRKAAEAIDAQALAVGAR